MASTNTTPSLFDMKVKSQPLIDIRTLSKNARQALVEGRKINIIVSDKTVEEVPLRLLLAVSSRAQHEFKQDRSFTELKIRNGVDAKSVKNICSWLFSVTVEAKRKCYAMPPTKDMATDIKLCRAAEQLGMRPYSNRVMKDYWKYFSSELPEYDELSLVVRLALSDQDALLNKVAANLHNRVVEGEMPDRDHFLKYVAERPKLARAMERLQNEEAEQEPRLTNRSSKPKRK
ncbi:hypothetical protein BDV96DRAFT_600341 [Lophiotrema nucula]|uniref:BTB domain-containing protein n=1 Tax=Lophiotrema nucula TaxID=690887 RepID=A0A6A5Z4K4_9PLEO|nr:hypothetical protein BDV96DRAFT_600341 [Lophiotrema nucula]